MQPVAHQIRSYKQLIVYQKAKENALVLLLYYKDKRLTWAERFIVLQLLRAVTSIGANVAEGHGRLYKKDYRRFISIARGSALEVEYWAAILQAVRLQDKQTLETALAINTELIKMLTVMMKKLSQ